MIDPRPHSAAIIAALTARGVAAFTLDAVPDKLPPRFAVVHIARRFNAPVRSSAETDIVLWRATVSHVGSSVNETLWISMRVAEALNEATLTIAGDTYGPIQFELEQEPEPDDGRFSGRSQWTY